MIFLKQKSFQLIIIILATILAYSNIFANTFVSDDLAFIQDWHDTRSLASIPKFFLQNPLPRDHEGVYRPVRSVALALSYQLWHTNVLGYHLMALVVHVVATIMVYLIVSQIGQIGKIPFIAALLFGLHPIHTESVTFMTTSFDTLGIAFFLGSFYLYLKARNQSSTKRVVFVISVFLALLAFFTYEMTLTLPLVILLYELCFRNGISIESLRKIKNQRSKIRDTYQKSKITRTVPYFIGVGIFLFIRISVLHIVGRGSYIDNSFYLTMLTMTRAWVKYIWLLIAPLTLSMDHTIAPGVQVYIDAFTNMDILRDQNLLTPVILGNIALLAGLIIIGWKSARRYPLVSFCLGWFFICLLPVAYLLPQVVILQEKYLYLASFGYCLLVAWVAAGLFNARYPKPYRLVIRRVIIGVIAVTAVFYGVRTYTRNVDWHDSITMWSSLARQLPNDVVTTVDLAKMYKEKGDDDQALYYFKRVLGIEPKIANVYVEIGDIYKRRGDVNQAREYYRQALRYYTDYLPAQQALEGLSKL